MTRSPLLGGPRARQGILALLAVAILLVVLVASSQVGALLGAGSSTVSPSLDPGASAPPVVLLPTPTPAPTEPAPTPTPIPTPIPTPVMVAAPLTGLPVTPEAALRHPVAVMVDDHAGARPQSGFNAASIVWHAPAEGGVPRYMLIFQDQVPADVGPIRSARQYYVEWAAEWQAMYVHHGGSPQALDTLRAKGNGQWVYNADGFRWLPRYVWRTTDRLAPHNVYTDGEHLRALAERLGADDEPIEPIWSFRAAAPRELRPSGTTIVVTYPYETITYRYDPATNRYVRYINRSKEPQVDRADGQIVAPTNVVILRMFFGALNDGHPDKHRLEARNVGTGVAWIATNGHVVKGTWKKSSQTAPTRLFGPDGEPISLTAGQTFVQVLPLTYGLDITQGKEPAWQPPVQAIEPD